MSILFSLVVQYSVENITFNCKVTASSFACVVKEAANQSRALQEQLAVPVDEMKGLPFVFVTSTQN